MPLVMEAERQRSGEWPTEAVMLIGMGAIAMYNAGVDDLNLGGGSGPGGASMADLRQAMGIPSGLGTLLVPRMVSH